MCFMKLLDHVLKESFKIYYNIAFNHEPWIWIFIINCIVSIV